jgi:hypothetical protein
LAGLTDDELKRLKDDLIRQKSETETDDHSDHPISNLTRKESQVKFNLGDDLDDSEEEN